LALGDEEIGVLLVDREPLHLRVRSARAADAGALVPVEAEPAERVEDDVDAGLRASLAVGVLDAEDERAAALAGPEPVEQRRPYAPDVKVSRRGGCETDALHAATSSRATTRQPLTGRSRAAGRRAAGRDAGGGIVSLLTIPVLAGGAPGPGPEVGSLAC